MVNNKKFSLVEALKDKRTRYGGFAAIITVMMIIVFFAVNILISYVNVGVDLTDEGLYTLSDVTEQVLKTVKDHVDIYSLYEGNDTNDFVINFIKRYDSACSKVSSSTVDPVQNPTFTSLYKNSDGTNPSSGYVVVQCGNRYKLIDTEEMIYYASDLYGNETSEQLLKLEQLVTSAISYVTSGLTPKVYLLDGHGEKGVSTALAEYLEEDNYVIETLTLMNVDKVPEDATVLVITGGTGDWAQEEADLLYDYMDRGGNIMYFYDYASNMDGETPVIDAFLKSYGIAIQKGIVYEDDSDHKFANTGYYLLPDVQEHDITTAVQTSGDYILLPMSSGIETLDVKRRELTVESILTTSSSAWLAEGVANDNITIDNAVSTGSYDVMVAITDQLDDYTDAKMVVCGDMYVMTDSYIDMYGNLDLVMGAFEWMNEVTSTVSITSKTVSYSYLNMTTADEYLWMVILVVVIPLAILIAGLVVFIKRKNL